ncbi:MAG: sel1 repeat family protein [Desulfurellaceae bacterium]|nr:sel1 repeat family protein [Desulfurellaceae bacterium]
MRLWFWLSIYIALLWACTWVRPIAAEDTEIKILSRQTLTGNAADCLNMSLSADTRFAACRAAAESGGGDARRNLGSPQDYAEAVEWFRRAAEQGDTSAQLNLGSMYFRGEGVPQDYTMAHMWYNLAGTGVGGEYARELRDNVAAQMTPVQIAEAQRLAREWAAAHQAGAK